MARDVFVNYSIHDKTTADAVCATLEANGLRCWIAPRDIVPGMNWGEAIIDAINTSRVMVLVFSSNANTSQQILREDELPSLMATILLSRKLKVHLGPLQYL
jgi:TIR domain